MRRGGSKCGRLGEGEGAESTIGLKLRNTHGPPRGVEVTYVVEGGPAAGTPGEDGEVGEGCLVNDIIVEFNDLVVGKEEEVVKGEKSHL